ncbi:MAG: type IX secretion system membrane protein PorP/SprF [Elusimicrobia bacterium]|nr:type IX secretion system membrane protein PorP/SprF [Elusimicrobiota bacterium]
MRAMTKISRLFLTVLTGAWYTGQARAAYDDHGVGARVVGLGTAYTAVADDVYAVYYNPAGLATLDRPQLATTYSKLFTGLSDNSNLQNSFMAFESPIAEGRQGAYGLAWNHFTLDSLYREMSLYGSYGRQLLPETAPKGLFGGVSFKLLNRSLGRTSVADNALGPTGQAQPGVADPVLKSGSKSNGDLDLGFLYRLQPRWTVGLAVQHLTQPNISFASNDADKLGRNVKLGLAYRTPFAAMTGDLQLHTAPDGSLDKTAVFGAEKWLPTLLHGSFGVRGSLGLGSRDFRQVTMGLSYKVHRMQVDYGFSMPLGTVSSTFGNHRMGLSFKFGRSRAAEPKLAEAILENMRELAEVGTPDFRYQAEELALYKRTALQEFVRQATLDASGGRFLDAQSKLEQAQALNPADKRLSSSVERVSVVATVFPEVTGQQSDAAMAALYAGALDFMAGRDKDAVRKLAYAQSLNPGDTRFEALLQSVEAKTGLGRVGTVEPGPTAPTLGMEKVVSANLALMEVALKEGDYDKVLRLAKEVLDIDPTRVLAYKRQAAAQYARKQYGEALASLKAAHGLERDSAERKTLTSYMDALEALLARQAAPAPKPAARPAAAPERPAPVDIERLYEAGVDLYAQGRLREAAEQFRRILEADPKNVSARRALDRVQADLLEGGRP